jgi:MFS family permease
VFLIPGSFRAPAPEQTSATPSSWKAELREGLTWLWQHPLFRSMAIILGLMNMADMMTGSMLVLFSQEVLDVTPLTFTLMGFGFAAGGIVGGYAAPWLSRTLGSGTCLALTLLSGAITSALVGISSSWPVVAVLFALNFVLGSTWNIITVSLRQSVIPSHLLGRVNSVYRFFAWGMMPVGALLGGLIVAGMGTFVDREWALRSVWFVSAIIHLALWAVGRRVLTTERLEAVRATASVGP